MNMVRYVAYPMFVLPWAIALVSIGHRQYRGAFYWFSVGLVNLAAIVVTKA